MALVAQPGASPRTGPFSSPDAQRLLGRNRNAAKPQVAAQHGGRHKTYYPWRAQANPLPPAHLPITRGMYNSASFTRCRYVQGVMERPAHRPPCLGKFLACVGDHDGPRRGVAADEQGAGRGAVRGPVPVLGGLRRGAQGALREDAHHVRLPQHGQGRRRQQAPQAPGARLLGLRPQGASAVSALSSRASTSRVGLGKGGSASQPPRGGRAARRSCRRQDANAALVAGPRRCTCARTGTGASRARTARGRGRTCATRTARRASRPASW